MSNKIITSFGSGFTKPEEPLYNDIIMIGRVIAERDWTVCSGGYYGTMEAISKGAKSAGGKTIGVTVNAWKKRPNKYIDEEVRLDNLMERIVELIGLADAYVVFKGGTGTLMEISLTLELMSKSNLPEKPLFFYGDFWVNVIETLKQDSQNVKELIERNLIYISRPEELVVFLK